MFKRFICLLLVLITAFCACFAEETNSEKKYLPGDYSDELYNIKLKLGELGYFYYISWETKKNEVANISFSYSNQEIDSEIHNGVYNLIMMEVLKRIKVKDTFTYSENNEYTYQQLQTAVQSLDTIEETYLQENEITFVPRIRLSCSDMNFVGYNWNFEFVICDESDIINHSIALATTPNIDFFYCLTEVDKYPDQSSGKLSVTLTEIDANTKYVICQPYVISVRENCGRYTGKICEWTFQLAFVREDITITDEELFNHQDFIETKLDPQVIPLRADGKPLKAEEPDLPEIDEEIPADGVAYIGNKNSKVFHYPTCGSVTDMKEKNKVPLSSREEAIEQGFKPCSRCKP